jgi:hypothetical protein
LEGLIRAFTSRKLSSPNSRANSILVHLSMITASPAALARRAASSLRTPSCSQRNWMPSLVLLRNDLINDLRNGTRGAENVDHLDRSWHVAQPRIYGFAKNQLFSRERIDRNDPIALSLKVIHHEVGGTRRRWRGANHGNGACLPQGLADEVVRVVMRLFKGQFFVPFPICLSIRAWVAWQ